MQHEKCCYCEMKIPHEGHLKAVEHFKPKSVYKSLTNNWKNLLLVCAQCNGKKSDGFPIQLTDSIDEAKVLYAQSKKVKGEPVLIDPSKEDPEEHLDFELDVTKETLGLIVPKNNSERGAKTIQVIGLFGQFYTKRHRKYILETLLYRFAALRMAKDNQDNSFANEHKSRFEQWMQENCEYAGLTRAFARHYGFDKYEIKIPT